MKLVGLVFGAILLVISIGIMVVQVQKHETDVILRQTKVAMLINGGKDDHSWSESHYIAMQKAAEALNLNVTYFEKVQEDSLAKSILEKAIKDGARIVVANSVSFKNVIPELSKKHQDVYFLHAAGLEKGPNLSSFFGRIYQMRYLSGIVAGLMTKTNEIGYVASYSISEVNRGINAFTLGVRKVNPDAKVFVNWSRSWTDSTLAADATNDLIERHNIDVLTVHTDALSPYEVAERRNVYMIGYNLDNASRFPNSFLTAPVWRWENYYTPHIMAVLQNKFTGEKSWLGVESGIVDLAPMTKLVPDSVKKIVEEEMALLKSGAYDVFYGPIEDNHGNRRVEEGESMTDMDMFDNFDWFVKGVINE